MKSISDTPRRRDLTPRQECEGLPAEFIPREYGDMGLGLLCRWEVYQYAADGRDLHQEIIDSLELAGHESVLDIGCAHGKVLDQIAPNHSGRLVGVDVVRDAFDFFHTAMGDDRYGLEFYQAGLPDLNMFESHSMDRILALFMLYHVEDLEKALSEITRLLAPGGTVIIATSGEKNKELHRIIEAEVSKILGIESPPIFSKKFNETLADSLLPKYFSDCTKVSQHTDMLIDTPESAVAYQLSLDSMWASCELGDSAEWARAVKNRVGYLLEPLQKGKPNAQPLIDRIDRHFYICRHPTT